MQVSEETIDFSEVAQLLRKGGRVSLFLRHSERPPIAPDDRTFGQTLALTPRGVELAHDAGKHLAGFTDVRFAASPMVRCRMTAQCIAEGMGLANVSVADEPRLGLGCFYYEDPVNLQDEMRQQGYLSFMLEYLRKGVAPYSHPIDVATEQMAAWLKDATVRSLNVLISHDIFVASFLTGLKVRTYTAENWVGFVHGAVIVNMPDRGWWCYPCVPEITATRDTSFVH
jgi:broad specificity phosphatase PhoE